MLIYGIIMALSGPFLLAVIKIFRFDMKDNPLFTGLLTEKPLIIQETGFFPIS